MWVLARIAISDENVGVPEGSAYRAPFVPLPSGIGGREGARQVFDGIADLYDVARPGYPDRLFDDIGACCDVGAGSSVLEIGCGTGQATIGLVRMGCAVLCVEAGPALAELARRNLARHHAVQVQTARFEEVSLPAGSYDLVFAATAFHWIDPAVGYPKAATLLRPSGHLALATNAHAGGGSEDRIAGDVQRLHREIAPDIGAWEFPTVEDLADQARAGGSIAEVWARIDRKFADPPDVSGFFGGPSIFTYPWRAEYGTAGYLAMLASQSSYASMGPDRRHRLLGAIGDLVERRLGGTVTKQYLTIMAIAPRVSA